MSQSENSICRIRAVVELAPVPFEDHAPDPLAAEVAYAALNVLTTRPDLLKVLKRSELHSQLSEHFRQESEAADEAVEEVWKALFDALPQSTIDKFDRDNPYQIFRETMALDVKFFVTKSVESHFE